MTQEELKIYLTEEAGYDKEELEEMSSFDLLESYLVWNGIGGYTADILSAIQGAYDLPPYTFPDQDDWE